MSTCSPFLDLDADPTVKGLLQLPAQSNGDTVVLTHGAGANCQSRLLAEMSAALAASGFTVLRFDLPFRQLRPYGPPSFGGAARDRMGIRRAVTLMRATTPGRLFVGGHSYGGRQASMLISEEPQLVDGLLLLSYPLHPPRKPGELRTSHFPKLTRPAFFVHGTRDPFATIAEMKSALEMIPAFHGLLEVDGEGHDLLPRKTAGEWPTRIVTEFQRFLKQIA